MSRTEAVKIWLREVVVAQNFCPFAGKPLANDGVLIKELEAGNNEALLNECLVMLNSFVSTDTFETAIFVLPKGYEDFFDYLDLADTVELMLEVSFENELKLATFHPEYQFAEFEPHDVVHHIHRAPFPLLHFLRESSVEKVKEHLADTSSITARNHQHAKALGADFFKKYQRGTDI